MHLRDLKLLWDEWATNITATFHLLSNLSAQHILQLKIIFVNYINFIIIFVDINAVTTIKSLKILSIHLSLIIEMPLTQRVDFFFLTCPFKAKHWMTNVSSFLSTRVQHIRDDWKKKIGTYRLNVMCELWFSFLIKLYFTELCKRLFPNSKPWNLPSNTKIQETDPCSISFLANKFLSEINYSPQNLIQVNDHLFITKALLFFPYLIFKLFSMNLYIEQSNQ